MYHIEIASLLKSSKALWVLLGAIYIFFYIGITCVELLHSPYEIYFFGLVKLWFSFT